jgi:opacity protein-like surface antigen
MKNLLLLFALFYSHLVVGQDICPDFKPLKKNVKIIKVSPDLFTAVTDVDFVVIPNLSGGLEFNLGMHFSLGGTIGGGVSQSLANISDESYNYALMKVESKYYTYRTFEKWWYGMKVSVFYGVDAPFIPLPTIHVGYTQRRLKNKILDYTAGIMYFEGAFFLNTGISWGFIYSKNKRVRA